MTEDIYSHEDLLNIANGGVVWIITGLWWLGLIEIVAHWIIDFGKCENWYGIHFDQGAHITCKILYCFI